jgi:hypothetical protein
MDFVLNRIVGHFLDDKPEQEPVGVAVIVLHPGRKQRRLFCGESRPTVEASGAPTMLQFVAGRQERSICS